MLFHILAAAVLALSLSSDTFAAAFAFSRKKVKIPSLSANIINSICTLITALSFVSGRLLLPVIHSNIALGLSFVIFLCIGLSKLFGVPDEEDVPDDLSIKESAKLALSLSLDNFAVGFAAALSGFNGLVLVGFSFIFNALALCNVKLPRNINWLASLILLGFAANQLLQVIFIAN